MRSCGPIAPAGRGTPAMTATSCAHTNQNVARPACGRSVNGLPASASERRLREGGWTLRELVLHLVARDKVRLEEFDRMLGGTHASWIGITSEHMDAINEWHLGELRHLGWEDARRRLDTMREALLGALHAVPAEPAEVWSPEHPFGRIMHALVAHDRHHAAQVKQLRLQG